MITRLLKGKCASQPTTVTFWVVQHPRTLKYANIWTYWHMGPEYGGHEWVDAISKALPFATKERASEWWSGVWNRRKLDWTELDEYTIGSADIVAVTVPPDQLQRDRTDSDEILARK